MKQLTDMIYINQEWSFKKMYYVKKYKWYKNKKKKRRGIFMLYE
jgi:hypothetical protein